MLKVKSQNAFQKLVYEKLAPLFIKNELKLELKTKTNTRVTRILNEPSKATNDELLLFEELLDVPAYILHTEYGLGTVTKRELKQHEYVYQVQQPIQAA